MVLSLSISHHTPSVLHLLTIVKSKFSTLIIVIMKTLSNHFPSTPFLQYSVIYSQWILQFQLTIVIFLKIVSYRKSDRYKANNHVLIQICANKLYDIDNMYVDHTHTQTGVTGVC